MIYVLDTNAYIDMVSPMESYSEVKEYVQILREKEKKDGCSAIAHPNVVMELMSHLLDTQGENPKYTYTKACVALYYHCLTDDGQVAMLPLEEVQFAQIYLKITNKNGIETQQNLLYILKDIAEHPSLDKCKEHSDNLNRVSRFIYSAEQTLIQTINQVKSQYLSMHPIYGTWEELLSEKNERNALKEWYEKGDVKYTLTLAMVMSVIQDLSNKKYTLPKDIDLKKITLSYMSEISASLQMYGDYLCHISDVNYKFDREDRVNVLWDAKVLNVVGHKLSSISNSDLCIVSTDNNMIKAAKTAVPMALIMKYVDYIQRYK